VELGTSPVDDGVTITFTLDVDKGVLGCTSVDDCRVEVEVVSDGRVEVGGGGENGFEPLVVGTVLLGVICIELLVHTELVDAELVDGELVRGELVHEELEDRELVNEYGGGLLGRLSDDGSQDDEL
jgi:hypothetical protein